MLTNSFNHWFVTSEWWLSPQSHELESITALFPPSCTYTCPICAQFVGRNTRAASSGPSVLPSLRIAQNRRVYRSMRLETSSFSCYSSPFFFLVVAFLLRLRMIFCILLLLFLRMSLAQFEPLICAASMYFGVFALAHVAKMVSASIFLYFLGFKALFCRNSSLKAFHQAQRRFRATW